MTRRSWLLIAASVIVLALLAWSVSRLLERIIDPPALTTGSAAAPAAVETAHIRATLFYGSSDGLALVPVSREVPLATDVAAQGREVVLAQLGAAPRPYVSVIPPGTKLRAFYISNRGDAFVDLSAEAATAHPGGSFTELLTVQAIVQAVTTNLPSARRVQILIDGKEVDTLAGHVDLRRPLTADASVNRKN